MVLETSLEVLKHAAALGVCDIKHLGSEVIVHGVTKSGGYMNFLHRERTFFWVDWNEHCCREQVESPGVWVHKLTN